MAVFPKFSAHIGYLFGHLPLDRRIEAASQAGFEAVEHPNPFEIPASRLKKLLNAAGLTMAQVSSGPGIAGQKGFACLRGHQKTFVEQFKRALDYAEEIGCPYVHPMAGILENGLSDDEAEKIWIDNIETALMLSQTRKVDVLIEAISRKVVPGYAIHRLDQIQRLAFRLSEQPKILIDTYHAALNVENCAEAILNFSKCVGHMHIADYPGRHEPGTGSFDFEPVLRALDSIDYRYTIGFEYIPKGETEVGLDWMETFRRKIGD